jgi:hypothetical protein
MTIAKRRITASAIGLALIVLSTLGVACRAPKNESPFESHGFRAGMRFSDLDHQTSGHGSEWTSEPFGFGIIQFHRGVLPPAGNTGGRVVRALVDTADDRVLELAYEKPSALEDTASFRREMGDLAAEWDKITGGVRHVTGGNAAFGPWFTEWVSPDSLWSGTIFYFKHERTGGSSASGLAIKDLKWQQRMFARLDSIKKAGGRIY